MLLQRYTFGPQSDGRDEVDLSVTGRLAVGDTKAAQAAIRSTTFLGLRDKDLITSTKKRTIEVCVSFYVIHPAHFRQKPVLYVQTATTKDGVVVPLPGEHVQVRSVRGAIWYAVVLEPIRDGVVLNGVAQQVVKIQVRTPVL